MKIGENEFTVEQITTALTEENNKADYDALRGNDLFKSEITQEGVQSYLETDDGKRLLQPKLDQYHTKGLQSWQEKNLDKIKDEARGEVKASLEEQIETMKTSMTANKINGELKLKLLSEGADKEDVDLLMRAVDMSTITEDKDGKLIGVNDVVNNLKESRPKWFNVTATPKGTGNATVPAGTTVAGANTLNKEAIMKLSDTERINYKRKNPNWWKQ